MLNLRKILVEGINKSLNDQIIKIFPPLIQASSKERNDSSSEMESGKKILSPVPRDQKRLQTT